MATLKTLSHPWGPNLLKLTLALVNSGMNQGKMHQLSRMNELATQTKLIGEINSNIPTNITTDSCFSMTLNLKMEDFLTSLALNLLEISLLLI